MYQTIAPAEVIDHKPFRDEKLFRDTTPVIFQHLKSLGGLSIEHTPPTPEELSGQLQDIIQYAVTEGDDLGRWRYPRESDDTHRVFTPWYGTIATYQTSFKVEQLDTRLHIRPGTHFAPQPIIHIEKRLRIIQADAMDESIYEGPEIVLDVRGAEDGITADINDGKSRRHRFNMRDTTDPYAFDALRAIRQAHAFLVVPAKS